MLRTLSRSLRAEVRELTLRPPLDFHVIGSVVLMIEAGTPSSCVHEIPGMPRRHVIRHWRKICPWFNFAILTAEEACENREVARVGALLDSGTPPTVKAIRRATGCTPKQALRLIAAVVLEADS